MMPAVAPLRYRQRETFDVQIARDDEAHALRVQTRRYPHSRVRSGDVKAINDEFLGILGDLAHHVDKHGHHLTPGECEHFLAPLRNTGARAYNRFFPEDARARLSGYTERAEAGGRTVSVTLTVSPELSPYWEMMYPADPDMVMKDCFWGLHHAIGRTFWELEPEDRIRLQAGMISAIDDSLKSSCVEIERLGEEIAVLRAALGRELSMVLFDGLVAIDGPLSVQEFFRLLGHETFTYGLVHFACHCDYPLGESAAEATLRFTVRGAPMALQLKWFDTYQGHHHFRYQPLVFLNACQSASANNLSELLNFPMGMLEFGAGGVIATACAVPDTFAAAFATEFYHRLLRLGTARRGEHRVLHWTANIGRVLLETRRYFLKEHNNPLGLAYGLYAMANQQLELTY